MGGIVGVGGEKGWGLHLVCDLGCIFDGMFGLGEPGGLSSRRLFALSIVTRRGIISARDGQDWTVLVFDS